MNRFIIITAILVALCMPGCAWVQGQMEQYDITADSAEVKLYKALKASALSYNAARETLRSIDRNRPFTDEQKAQIEQYAEKYRLAYHGALETWGLYDQGKATDVDWIAAANDALDVYKLFERMITDGK